MEKEQGMTDIEVLLEALEALQEVSDRLDEIEEGIDKPVMVVVREPFWFGSN